MMQFIKLLLLLSFVVTCRGLPDCEDNSDAKSDEQQLLKKKIVGDKKHFLPLKKKCFNGLHLHPKYRSSVNKTIANFSKLTNGTESEKREAGNIVPVCESMKKELEEHMKKTKELSPDAYKAIIIKSCKADYTNERDRTFPFNLMEKLTRMEFLKKDTYLKDKENDWLRYITKEDSREVSSAEEQELIPHFFLRHYTFNKENGPPLYTSIKSNYEMFSEFPDEEKKEGNTNFEDWLQIGNPTFTFWNLGYDGIINKGEKIKFIENNNYFVDIGLDQESLERRGLENAEFFASGDLIERAFTLSDNPKPKFIRGKLKDLVALVIAQVYTKEELEGIKDDKEKGNRGQQILRAIEEHFRSRDRKYFAKFEIKIPGTVDLKDAKWELNPTYKAKPSKNVKNGKDLSLVKGVY